MTTATLTLAHHIYLDRDQRRCLNEGREVKVTGVLVPVWIMAEETSEPAREIFCSYKIRNDRSKMGVRRNRGGFIIDMPYFDIVGGEADEETIRAARERLGTSELLLDFDEGGKEQCEFRFQDKMTVGGRSRTVVHFVEIKSNELLESTLA